MQFIGFTGSRSRSGSAASNRSGSPVRNKKRSAVLSDSEDEGQASQAIKRAKIIDSDNEEVAEGEEQGEPNELEGIVDAGESSDEGVREEGGGQG